MIGHTHKRWYAMTTTKDQLAARKGHGALPTVADVLALPEVQYGRPEVDAGDDHLDRPVRWAHVSELPDIANLLQGGELVLTTGIALPESDEGLRSYVSALADVDAAGLMIELGRRFSALPKSLVTSCHRNGLPLVALQREVKFVKVTEAVHSLVIEEQFAYMREAVRVHEVFTSLCVDGATAIDIVREASHLTGCPVVFENLMHQVIAYDAARVPADDLLRNWEARSRSVVCPQGTTRDTAEGWILTPVSARGETWGRLLLAYGGGTPTSLEIMIVERAAVALTLNRLLERSQETLERQAHRSTLSDIIEDRFKSSKEMQARMLALGIPTSSCALVSIVVDIAVDTAEHEVLATAHRRADQNAELVNSAVRAVGTRALVGALHARRVGILLPIRTLGERETLLRKIALCIEDLLDSKHKSNSDEPHATQRRVLIGVGSLVTDLSEVRRSFAEAGHVVEAARGCAEVKLYYELPDIQLQGLLYILADDPRVQAFVERTLGPLLDHDARHSTGLVETLRIYLESGRNKSAAADDAFLSRQALYQRLSSIERILDVDLASADVCTSLHAAIMAIHSRHRHADPQREHEELPRAVATSLPRLTLALENRNHAHGVPPQTSPGVPPHTA